MQKNFMKILILLGLLGIFQNGASAMRGRSNFKNGGKPKVVDLGLNFIMKGNKLSRVIHEDKKKSTDYVTIDLEQSKKLNNNNNNENNNLINDQVINDNDPIGKSPILKIYEYLNGKNIYTNDVLGIEEKIKKFNGFIMMCTSQIFCNDTTTKYERQINFNYNIFVGEHLIDDVRNNDLEIYELKKELVGLLTKKDLDEDTKNKLLENILKKILRYLLNIYVDKEKDNIKDKEELSKFLKELVESFKFKFNIDGQSYFEVGNIKNESFKKKMREYEEMKNKHFFVMNNISFHFIYHIGHAIDEYLKWIKK